VRTAIKVSKDTQCHCILPCGDCNKGVKRHSVSLYFTVWGLQYSCHKTLIVTILPCGDCNKSQSVRNTKDANFTRIFSPFLTRDRDTGIGITCNYDKYKTNDFGFISTVQTTNDKELINQHQQMHSTVFSEICA
jgi:hypothetical protein